jgi:hypothetical protein
MKDERVDPITRARELGNPPPPPSLIATSVTITLGPNSSDDNPKYSLGWTVTNPQSNADFIALYESPSTGDHDYLRSQWQYTNRGNENPYTTGTFLIQGYEARYLIKNSGGQYFSIARTGPFIFPHIEGSGNGSA